MAFWIRFYTFNYYNLLDDSALHTNISFNSYASYAPMTSKKKDLKKAIEISSNKKAHESPL